jgi:hypothetical protein
MEAAEQMAWVRVSLFTAGGCVAALSSAAPHAATRDPEFGRNAHTRRAVRHWGAASAAGTVGMEVIQMSVQTSQRPKAEDAIEAAPVLMINEERERLVGTCDGPDPQGRCPRAHADGSLPCDGLGLLIGPWAFRVASDARMCPVAVLGLTSARLRQAPASANRRML